MPDYQVRWHDEAGQEQLGLDLPLERVMDEQWDIVEMTGTSAVPVEWDHRISSRTYTATPMTIQANSVTAATTNVRAYNPVQAWTVRANDIERWMASTRRVFNTSHRIEYQEMPNFDPRDSHRWLERNAHRSHYMDLRLWADLDERHLYVSEWVQNDGQMYPREEAERLAREEAERRRQQELEEERRREEERIQRAQAEQERVAAREARAKELLMKFLDEEQIAMLNEESYFDVEAEDGNVFRIRNGKVGNIRCVEGHYEGREFCIHDSAYLPNFDTMFLQKVMIQSDYERFLRIANY